MQLKSLMEEESKEEDPVEFNVKVLTRGDWPSLDLLQCKTLTQSLVDQANKYTLYYNNQENYKKRKLNWLHQYGSVEIKATFTHPETQKTKSYQLVCNVFQASILGLFNTCEQLTFKQLLYELMITPVEDVTKREEVKEYEKSKHVVTECLKKFCEPKMKLLLKTHNNPVFLDDEVIQVNTTFGNKAVRLNLIPRRTEPRSKDTSQSKEDREMIKQIEKERIFQIQAKIMKSMKAIRFCSENQLIEQVIKDIKMFKAEVKTIKEQIKNLMQKEYLEYDS